MSVDPYKNFNGAVLFSLVWVQFWIVHRSFWCSNSGSLQSGGTESSNGVREILVSVSDPWLGVRFLCVEGCVGSEGLAAVLPLSVLL